MWSIQGKAKALLHSHGVLASCLAVFQSTPCKACQPCIWTLCRVCSGKGGVETLQHSHDVLALAYRPDGKMLASATLDGQVYLWDPQDAQLLVSCTAALAVFKP